MREYHPLYVIEKGRGKLWNLRGLGKKPIPILRRLKTLIMEHRDRVKFIEIMEPMIDSKQR